MKFKSGYLLLLVMIEIKCFAQIQMDTSTSILHNYHMQPIHLFSRWAKSVDPNNTLKEYPRPQMERNNWENLNGLWDYAITDTTASLPNNYDGKILVPYPIESALSGVKKQLSPSQLLWYRKKIPTPTLNKNERLMLNFGAVDWLATVYINGKQVFSHTGGYQSFSVDITNYIGSYATELIIKVYDPTDKGINPHGKQVLDPQNIYYTPSSGIWQTVWLEKVNATYISHIKSTPNIDKGLLAVNVTTTNAKPNMKIEITATSDGKVIAQRINPIFSGKNEEKHNEIVLSIPNQHLWTPDDPFLYDMSIKILQGSKVVDEVKSYFGMRKVNIQKDEKGSDRIFLNNIYTYNLGVLDQGFWPEGLYTAPTDDALSFDIKAIRSMGFNTIRKHIKIEPERWYYHADKIGVLVWQDFVNPPHLLPEGSKIVFEKEIKETIDQLYNHPSIVSWVLFNERWGAYDQKRLTKWVKEYDSTRIINGHSGELLYVNNQLRAPSDSPWIFSDVTDVHSYPDPRNPPAQPNKAKVVGEFGGIGVSVPNHEWDDIQGWGYIQVNPSELKSQYKHMIENLKKLESAGLSASIYTQPFDVEGEENGLLTYDREVTKIPISDLRDINKNLVPQDNHIYTSSAFYIAADIDTSDNDTKYEQLLASYRKEQKDSAFLRRLTLMAIRKKDQENATLVGNKYFGSLTQPYAKENLIFILKTIRSSKDKGFSLFLSESNKVDSIIGGNAASQKVKTIIDDEEIVPYMGNGNKPPNWEAIQQKVASKYGSMGEIFVLGKRMVYYGFQVQDWKNFEKYYVLYFKKGLANQDFLINNVTWLLFEHINDPDTLEFATNVMKYTIEKWDRSPEAFDTYANLLHRTNKSHEAIQWEEKALKLKKGAPDEKIYAETLQKMKSGLPTWPQNN